MRNTLDYKLSHSGRIHSNIETQLGHHFLSSPTFIHDGRILPNPYLFAQDEVALPWTIRPLLGPVHGDCHSQNIFVQASQGATANDVFLIDFATYDSRSLIYFDHAYLELATLLRQMDQLGEHRWFALVQALTSSIDPDTLEHNERGWVEDILDAREHIFSLASQIYPARIDDLRIQFIVAQVAVGLSFLNKIPRGARGSLGLTRTQYQMCYVWAAGFLRQLYDLLNIPVDTCTPSGMMIPTLGVTLPPIDAGASLPDLSAVHYYDASGFNIIVLASNESEYFHELFSLPWRMVIDFRPQTPIEPETQLLQQPVRQTWPGEPTPDPKLLSRGTLWYSADGRDELSDAEPTSTPLEWRRRYRRPLDNLLFHISETTSPASVRVLVVTDRTHHDYIRHIIESIDTAFHKALLPIVVTSVSYTPPIDDTLPVPVFSLRETVSSLSAMRDAAPLDVGVGYLPRRQAGEVTLELMPIDLFERVSRDFTVVSRGKAHEFPSERIFGVDFRRGMPIEWAELAQNLDVPRKGAYDHYYSAVANALRSSSNQTVNLLHEPSSGGTTLSRRIAWDLMEMYPVLVLEQLSTETAAHLRDVAQHCSLPALVIMESGIITESEREGLLQQLREYNTRAVFLWVARSYGHSRHENILQGQLDDMETQLFLDAYLEQITEDRRKVELHWLASSVDLIGQRSPFFFGLTAFGENFLGIAPLVSGIISYAQGNSARELIAALSLVTMYSSAGFPRSDFEELCHRFNDDAWPVPIDSPFLLVTTTQVRVSHALLAERALVGLARNPDLWRVDLSLFARNFLRHLASLEHKISERIQNVVQALFITRDIETALQADTDAQVGGIPGHARFSPLINDLGSVEQARSIFRTVVRQWPQEPHYAAHLARHLLYEDPKEIDEAVQIATRAELMTHAGRDASLVHVTGMTYRVRMEQRLRECLQDGATLELIENDTRSDFEQAISHFNRAIQIKPGAEHGFVATIQTVTSLLRLATEIDHAMDIGQFLKTPSRRWYLDALAVGDEKIDLLRNRPHMSLRAQKTVSDWHMVYGRVDKVIGDLRHLASRYEDMGIRRALCSAIVVKAKHNWNSIAQGDLQTIALMMERNITQNGARDADVRRWLSAYRRMRSFDVNLAIERLVDWHRLSPRSVDPVYYLYVFFFLRWLVAPAPRGGLAKQVTEWLKHCQANRPLGERTWSYEWLEAIGGGYRIVHFSDLGFDPPSVVRDPNHSDRGKLETRLARVTGIMRSYRGPQNATLDLGQDIMARITPLDRFSKDDEGKRISAFVSFSYDGLVGWDPVAAG